MRRLFDRSPFVLDPAESGPFASELSHCILIVAMIYRLSWKQAFLARDRQTQGELACEIRDARLHMMLRDIRLDAMRSRVVLKRDIERRRSARLIKDEF